MNVQPEPTIVYEDDDLAVINKPAGVVVTTADTVKDPTIQEWWAERVGEQFPQEWGEQIPPDFDSHFGDPLHIWTERQGVVHRLDKETSGALVLAKHPGALVALLRQFKDRQVSKKYLCLTHGKFTVLADTISLPMGRASHNRMQFAVLPEGRPAITEYQVLEYFAALDLVKLKQLPAAKGHNVQKKAALYQGFSLVECWPKTGRTHQIRVHLAHLRHPLVGDSLYAGKKRQQLDRIWCPRQFLHAAQVELTHPRHKKVMSWQAELAPDLQQALTLVTSS